MLYYFLYKGMIFKMHSWALPGVLRNAQRCGERVFTNTSCKECRIVRHVLACQQSLCLTSGPGRGASTGVVILSLARRFHNMAHIFPTPTRTSELRDCEWA